MVPGHADSPLGREPSSDTTVDELFETYDELSPTSQISSHSDAAAATAVYGSTPSAALFGENAVALNDDTEELVTRSTRLPTQRLADTSETSSTRRKVRADQQR